MDGTKFRACWALFAGAMLAFALTAPAHAADSVGAASSLRPKASQAQKSVPAADIALNAAIYQNATLATAPQGALEVTFLDKSKLSMGGGSNIVVDKYVYDGSAGAGEQVLKYTKGAFRFISGTIPKDKVKIETPSVTIGIRGTTIRTLVTDDGTTTVGLDHGEAYVTSKQTGQSVTLQPGEKVTIKPNGEMGAVTLGKVEGCP